MPAKVRKMMNKSMAQNHQWIQSITYNAKGDIIATGTGSSGSLLTLLDALIGNPLHTILTSVINSHVGLWQCGKHLDGTTVQKHRQSQTMDIFFR